VHAPTESLGEVNFKVPLTKRARPDGECERFTLRGSWLVTLGAPASGAVSRTVPPAESSIEMAADVAALAAVVEVVRTA
jgi:hypothetical protein